MHERSVAKNMLSVVLEKTKDMGAEYRIKKIRVLIGEFTMIQKEQLVDVFHELSKSTKAENAAIIITSSPLKGKCRNCHKDFLLNKTAFVCPFCNCLQIDIISGDELFIQDIEVVK